jgi:phosphate transport system substrate-binding protein
MKKMILFAALVLLSGTMVFAGGDAEADTAADESLRLSMGGSTTVEPVITRAIEVYQATVDENAELSYDAPGSSAGVRGVLDGTYDIGAASRGLKGSEIEAGAVPTQIAIDGLAVIVNGSVPVDDLTLEQVAQIFIGEISNWSEVGGADAEIVVVNRDEASGTRGAFVEIVLESYTEDPVFDEDLVVESNGDMAQKVAQTPNAIGYASLAVLDVVRDAGGKSLAIGGVKDSEENVLNGSYPIARPLNVATMGEPEGQAKVFIDFLLSETGQQIVVEVGYLPVK